MPEPTGTSQLAMRVRQKRREAGLTQRELAVMTGVSISVIRALEQGTTTRPHGGTTQRIATALGLTPAALLPRPGAEDVSHGRDTRATASASPQSAPRIRVQLLGPLAVWREGQLVRLGPPHRQAVLALLAADPLTLLPRDDIIDALWADDPPPTAAAMIHTYVSRLRAAFAPPRHGLIRREGPAYQIHPTTETDLHSFRALGRKADQATLSGDAVTACDLYEQALRTWRGQPLAGLTVLTSHPLVTSSIREHKAAVLSYARAAATISQDHRALPYLHALSERDPLDEQSRASLILALAATGNRAAALAAYEETRRLLNQELATTPGPELTAARVALLRNLAPALAYLHPPKGPTLRLVTPLTTRGNSPRRPQTTNAGSA